jgi:hypothetical protein
MIDCGFVHMFLQKKRLSLKKQDPVPLVQQPGFEPHGQTFCPVSGLPIYRQH